MKSLNVNEYEICKFCTISPTIDICCVCFSRGKFRFERADGSTFETPIPPFALDSKEEETPETPRTT